jgi:hypothetical protein
MVIAADCTRYLKIKRDSSRLTGEIPLYEKSLKLT